MSLFYLGAALSVVIFLLFIAFPWIKKSTAESGSNLTNKSLIKQRLNELHTEQQQGLLSDTDRLQSENELKLALLEETKTSESAGRECWHRYFNWRIAKFVGWYWSVSLCEPNSTY